MFPSFTPLYQVVDAMAFVSLLLISVLLLSYIVIPTKSQANMIKISGVISLWILISVKCFTMFQPYAKTFCQNSIQAATFRNPRCGIQAFLVTFGLHAVALWASMRAYTLLALITFQKSVTSMRWRVAMSVVCWGIPLMVAVAAIATREVGYLFGGLCGPRANLQPAFFPIPILVSYGMRFKRLWKIESIPAFFAEAWFLIKVFLIFRKAPTRPLSSPGGAQGEILMVDPNVFVKTTVPPRDEDAILQNGAVSSEYSDMSELAGAQGGVRQKGAVRKVLLLNWRGIVHTTMTMILTNYSTFTWLSMLKSAANSPEAAARATGTWYECVLQLGFHSARCQTLASKIVNLRAIWKVELILSLLGIIAFILETSRKLWWLGWRDYFSHSYISLLTVLGIRRVTPAPLRVSEVFTSSVAHKSPRINALYLNRDLPSLPLDVDIGISLFSFAHGSPTATVQSRDNASAV